MSDWQTMPVMAGQERFYAAQTEKLRNELVGLVNKHDLLKKAGAIERYTVPLPPPAEASARTHGFAAHNLWKLHMCILRAKADAGFGKETPRPIESFIHPDFLLEMSRG